MEPVTTTVALGAAGSAVWWAVQQLSGRVRSKALARVTEQQVTDTLTDHYRRAADSFRHALVPATRNVLKNFVGLYTQQFARLQTTTTGERFGQAPAEPLTGLVGQHRSLLLLGRPGSGKSAFLRSLALGINQIRGGSELSVLIDARAFGQARSPLKEYLIRDVKLLSSLPNQDELLDELFANGKLHVLWDALDEVATRDDLRHVVNGIENTLHDAPKCHQIVTCRGGAYAGWLPKFATANLQPFLFEDMQHFVDQWFADDPKRAAALKANLTDEPAARDLVSSPLFLSLLCVAAEDNLHPIVYRVELFTKSLNAALTRWDASRAIDRYNDYKNIQAGDRHTILRDIAHASVRRDTSLWRETDMKVVVADSYRKLANASADVDGLAIMEAIASQHGVIERHLQGTWSFSHWSLEEYLAAERYAQDPRETEALLALALKKPRLRGVAVNAMCIADDASALTEHLASLILSAIQVDQMRAQTTKMRKEFTTSRTSTPTVTRQLCFEVVAFQLQQIAIYVDGLIADLATVPASSDFSERITKIAGAFLVEGSGYANPKKLSVLYSRDRYHELLQSAMEELAAHAQAAGLSAESLRLFDLSSPDVPLSEWPVLFTQWLHFREFGQLALTTLQAVGLLAELSVAGSKMQPNVRVRTLSSVLERAKEALTMAPTAS